MATGAITLTRGSQTVKGLGSSFLSEIFPGQYIVVTIDTTVGPRTYFTPVKSVESDTSLTLIAPFASDNVSSTTWDVIPDTMAFNIPTEMAQGLTLSIQNHLRDKDNWNKIFTQDGDVTLTMPDGMTYTGPSWKTLLTKLDAAVATMSAQLQPMLTASQLAASQAQVYADRAKAAATGTLIYATTAQLQAARPTQANILAIAFDTGLYWMWDGATWTVTEAMFNGRWPYRGMIWPFRSFGKRNNVNPIDLETVGSIDECVLAWKYVFLNVRVHGATKGYYYRIANFDIDSCVMRLEMATEKNFATSNTMTILYNRQVPGLAKGQGVKTIRLEPTQNLDLIPGPGVVFEITIDTDYMNLMAGKSVLTNDPTSFGYTYWLDQSSYEYTEYDAIEKKLGADIEKNIIEKMRGQHRNQGQMYPYINLGLHTGITSNPEDQLDNRTTAWEVLNNIFLDVKVLNASPEYYYRITYWAINMSGSWLMQAEMVTRANFDKTTGNPKYTIHSSQFKPTLNEGIQTYIIPARNADRFRGTDVVFELTLDTDKIAALDGKGMAIWDKISEYYSWFVDPRCYVYKEDSRNAIHSPRQSFGVKAPIETSTRLGIEPIEEMNRLLNGGVGNRYYPHSAVAQQMAGEISWVLPTCSETSFDRLDSFVVPSDIQAYDIPVIAIDSRVDHSPIDPCMFKGHVVNSSGWLVWNYIHDAPIRGRMSGTVTMLVRIPDKTTRIQTLLAVRNIYNVNPNLQDLKWPLGLADSGNESDIYEKLNEEEFLFLLNNVARYTPEVLYRQWIEGMWVKKTIAINKDVVFYPQHTYSLRLYVYPKGGTQFTREQRKSTDVILLSGGLSMTYNARARISRYWSHMIDGGSTK